MPRSFLVLISVLIFGLQFLGDVQAETRPNVIVILTDDQGWGDLSLNGNQDLQTPHVDSLAREGAMFDRFYVCPVCSPTRAEFLTGRYHSRSGVYSTSAGGERIDLDEMTIAQTFKAAGYATAAFGKWHSGMQYPYHPNGRGFDEYYGFCSGHWGDYFSPLLEDNGKLVTGEGFLIDDFTNRAMNFIETQSSKQEPKPFFAYLAYNTPHSPMQVPDRWWNTFKKKSLKMHNRDPQKENLGHQRAALAMCENIDWNVGRLLKQLEERKLAENTIVIYFCDNGPNGYRWNGDMKGRKGSTDEGGVRSPFLIRWPKMIKPNTVVKANGAAIDLLPTLADMVGIPVTSKKPLDGISLKNLILGKEQTVPNRLIFSHWNGRVSARSQKFCLDFRGKLYDLKTDPGQRHDISAQHPAETARMSAAVKKWKAEVMSQTKGKPRPFPIGHTDFRYTQLPARDAEAHGNLKRSNRFPNCSFFTNWISVDDQLIWNAEVMADGDYEVELQYTCPKADVGSIVELSFGQQKVQGKIIVPHDPPLRGQENDRVQRTESYVKTFRTLNLGTIHLEKGMGQLTLKALSMPGSQVMDFRLLMLTRKTEE